MLQLPVRGVASHAVEGALDEVEIIGMGSLSHQLQCRLDRSIILQDAISFIGPEDLFVGDIPTEASRDTQFLRFGQIGLASPQRIFSPLAFRDLSLQPFTGTPEVGGPLLNSCFHLIPRFLERLLRPPPLNRYPFGEHCCQRTRKAKW